MLFIFCQSALPAELSQQESGVVVRFLAGVTGLEEGLVSFVVRKGAHFLEYLVLGISLFWTVRVSGYGMDVCRMGLWDGLFGYLG